MTTSIVTTFTTTSASEDILLTQSGIRQRICEKLSGISDTELTQRLMDNSLKIDFVIFFSSTNKVSINNGYWNSLIEDMVYASGTPCYINSIKIQNIASGTILINVY